MSEEPPGISKKPVNILFNPSVISKRDVWEIDLIHILDILVEILKKTDNKDLRVAGMAALSSSLIYRMKVESIFALQKSAMERKPVVRRDDMNIDMVDIPYRHESTYPVSLEDLMGLLENLISSIASTGSRRRKTVLEPNEIPNFQEYFNTLENVIERYESMIMKRIAPAGSVLLQEIVSDLEFIDAIRCFFAALFLAKDGKVDLEQIGDDIRITLPTGA